MDGQTNTLASVSLVLGVLSLLGMGCCCVPIINNLAMFLVPMLALAAIGTGFAARQQAARMDGAGSGMAVGGMALGVTTFLVGIGMFVLLVVGVTGLVILDSM